MIYFDMTIIQSARRSGSELCFRSSLSTTGFPTSCKHKKGHKKKKKKKKKKTPNNKPSQKYDYYNTHDCGFLTRKAAERVSGKDGGGIENTIVFVDNCPVLFRRNFSVDANLVNGSSGKFKALVRDVNDQAYVDGTITEAPPLFALVEFPKYIGPPFSKYEGEEKYVPILFKEADVLVKKKAVDGTGKMLWDRITRRGLPLMLAYAITVHRCQGMTILKGILDFEKKEFCAGLTFTALSRFASLFHFLIESRCFYEARFEGLRSFQMMYRIAEDARLLHLSDPDNESYLAAWEVAKHTVLTTKSSTLPCRIPGGTVARIKNPTCATSAFPKKKKAKRIQSASVTGAAVPAVVDDDDDDDDDDEVEEDDDDAVYEDKRRKKLERTAARQQKQREEWEREQAVINQANEDQRTAYALIINVPETARLGINVADFSSKIWCLKEGANVYLKEITRKIAIKQKANKLDRDMFSDIHSVNFINYYFMKQFFSHAYLGNQNIDCFVSLSLKYRGFHSPHERIVNGVTCNIPGAVNDHDKTLSTADITYLPAGFYPSLTGYVTNVPLDDYDFERYYSKDFTQIYDTPDYLLRDILSIVHRPSHWIMFILMPLKKAVIIIDPFLRDPGKDVGKNVLRWYQDEAMRRFHSLDVFNNLDTQSWTIISGNNNSPFNVIYTPIQTDGTSCGVLCALMAYYFIMYGTLPTRLDFSCHPVHIEKMRLFMHGL
jgi:hypothetical protein